MMVADPLATYNSKRDFAKTAEPQGALAPGRGNRFMVQKHDATRLHWDLRLEVDGVMKSWAVTRGPSLNPDDKRLAVQTEDHPLSYADFEGIIPSTEYGGGTVMLWDDGSWAPIPGKSASDLEKGHLHFVLHGEHMKGEWLLIRLKPRGKERNTNWLLRKVADGFAGGSDDLVEGALTSVKTGRTMEQIASGQTAGDLAGWKTRRRIVPSSARGSTAKGAKAGKLPTFQPPQLCTLVDSVPTGPGWIHEVKYDGYRALVAVAGGKAKVFTRSGLDWTDKFPGIVEAAEGLPVGSALIDGEIVAMNHHGVPDFSALQAAISDGKTDNLIFYAFDLLFSKGEDLRRLPLSERK
ncbi:MAG: ATP-dependent DNA ligase, partial [Pseudomonadota bacterium]|nr:ATP-dependent DNA ligase [Pseudomonadota bacterium]